MTLIMILYDILFNKVINSIDINSFLERAKGGLFSQRHILLHLPLK